MKNLKTLLLFSVLILLFTSCADKVTVTAIAETSPHIYGFWGGVWHGWTMVFQFIGSLIWDDASVYAVANNGHWYDFGYVGGFWLMAQVTIQLIKLMFSK